MRIRLTDDDVELIVASLELLHKHSIVNPDAFPDYALASKQRMQQLKDKLGKK